MEADLLMSSASNWLVHSNNRLLFPNSEPGPKSQRQEPYGGDTLIRQYHAVFSASCELKRHIYIFTAAAVQAEIVV